MIRAMRTEAATRKKCADAGTAPCLAAGRAVLLFFLFFAMCLGLGYPSLNRVDWRIAPGLTDVQWYADMVAGRPPLMAGDHRVYRVLVPAMARPVYRLSQGRIGTWSPEMLGLLTADSLLVAGTALLLLMTVMRIRGRYAVALGSALVYLLNFAVPNVRLAGFIDAGESFFLMAVTWCLLTRRWWMLPLLAVPGALAKELFAPFLIAFSGAWWLCERRRMAQAARAAGWMAASWLAGLVTLSAVQWRVGHIAQTPVAFGLSLRGDQPIVGHLVQILVDRNLWYTFFWLAPLGAVRVSSMPRAWRMATAAAAFAAIALDTYYGGLPGTIARTMFSVAGPLLSGSAAMLLFEGDAVVRGGPAGLQGV